MWTELPLASLLDYVDDHEVAASTGLDEAVEETFPASDPIAAGEHWRSEYDGLAVSGLGLSLVA